MDVRKVENFAATLAVARTNASSPDAKIAERARDFVAATEPLEELLAQAISGGGLHLELPAEDAPVGLDTHADVIKAAILKTYDDANEAAKAAKVK